MNNPSCPSCRHVFPWFDAVRRLFGPRRDTAVMWGIRCPECGVPLKVPITRVLLIAASGIFFGSQTSTLLVLSDLSRTEFWLAKLWLIVGFYAIAVFFFLKLERIE